MAAGIITKAGFPDVLDPRFREVTFQTFAQQKDMVDFFYTKEESTQFTERGTDITPMGDLVEFTGTITYDSPDQGYDWTASHKEFALGIQVERLIWEFDQYGVIDNMYSELASAAHKKRQKEAARFFNRAFILDETYFSTTEGVPLCSNSHTTTRSGVSTTDGFDNLATSAFSPTSLGAAILQFRKFKDQVGERINVVPDMLLVPIDLRDRVLEVVKTVKGLDSAEGNINVYNSDYDFKIVDWIYLTDTSNWFLIDSKFMKKNLKWYDKIPIEFGRVEDFDTLVAKYRAYAMWSMSRGGHWQWVLGSNVS